MGTRSRIIRRTVSKIKGKDIFVSRPNNLASEFETAHREFEAFLRVSALEPKTLGRNAYSLKSPMDAVINLMKSCDGAIILGYPQHIFSVTIAKGAHFECDKFVCLPTPWNQIEGVLAYQINLPTLVIAHADTSGGIFDHGVLGKFIFTADLGNPKWFHKRDKIAIFKLWKKEVEQYGKKKGFY